MTPSRKRLATGRSRSRGQSLVEFALVFPLFILLLAGMVDFGIGLYSYMTLVNATREGARLGATNCTVLACTSAVTARVTAAASGLEPQPYHRYLHEGAPRARSRAPRTRPSAGRRNGVKNGDSVTVTSSYTYHMIWPLTFGTVIPMTSTVTFMAE